MKFSNEIKTGIVVLGGIAIAVLFFTKTTDIRTDKYELKTYFTYAGDLKPDATVKLSGVEVGRLISMKFVYDKATKVECILELDGAAKVRTDSIAYIGTAGFVGDAYIGITPGAAESEFAAPGSVIVSDDPVQMRLLMKKADDIANNLDSILVEVKSLVVDNRQGLDNIVGNLEAATKNLEEFSEDVKDHPWKLLFKGD